MKLISLSGLFLICLSAFSQEAEMADTLRSEGKIYVVVIVILTILIGLLVYLISIDRKLAKLEKRRHKENQS